MKNKSMFQYTLFISLVFFAPNVFSQNIPSKTDTEKWILSKCDSINYKYVISKTERTESLFAGIQKISFKEDTLIIVVEVGSKEFNYGSMTTKNHGKVNIKSKTSYYIPLKDLHFPSTCVSHQVPFENEIKNTPILSQIYEEKYLTRIKVYTYKKNKNIKMHSRFFNKDTDQEVFSTLISPIEFTNEIEFIIPYDENIPARLTKALNHLIILNNGKKEIF